MGTIVNRARKDKTVAYLAKISIMRDGQIYRENKTFDRKQAAAAWIAKREEELSKPGAIEKSKSPGKSLADAIDQYTEASIKEIGRTKAQVLRSIKEYEIAKKACEQIGSADIVAFAQELIKGDRKPQTVGNYIAHLSAVFTVAGPAWGFQLDRRAMEDATVVMHRLGIIAKSDQRERRPTCAELDTILSHFTDRSTRIPKSAPMVKLIAFAIFSTRRQEEICRIQWADLDEAHSRVLVRDMKNPGEKIGNDVWCDLPPEAFQIIKTMPKKGPQIFPYNSKSIGSAFTRACALLGIDDLHFHDLRHDGVSRLFELGWNIPHVASVSGHRSWTSLKRYTHLKQTGDKYAGWKWLAEIIPPPLP